MAPRVHYPHIQKKAGQPACLSRLTRIRVAQIAADYLAHGWSVDEMCRQYPHLRHAEAHAAMGYYWDYQEEIDAEIAEEWRRAKLDASQASKLPVIQRLRSRVPEE